MKIKRIHLGALVLGVLVLLALFVPVVPTTTKLKPTSVLYLKPSPGYDSPLEFTVQYADKNKGWIYITNHTPYTFINASFVVRNMCPGGQVQVVMFYYGRIDPNQKVAPAKVTQLQPFDPNSCQGEPYSDVCHLYSYVIGEASETQMITLTQYLLELRPTPNQTMPEPAPVYKCI